MDKITLAAKLAETLRTLADACEQAAKGDQNARRVLEDHIDGYWHGLVVGANKVEQLLSDEE